jgi:hypothetical protein
MKDCYSTGRGYECGIFAWHLRDREEALLRALLVVQRFRLYLQHVVYSIPLFNDLQCCAMQAVCKLRMPSALPNGVGAANFDNAIIQLGPLILTMEGMTCDTIRQTSFPKMASAKH